MTESSHPLSEMGSLPKGGTAVFKIFERQRNQLHKAERQLAYFIGLMYACGQPDWDVLKARAPVLALANLIVVARKWRLFPMIFDIRHFGWLDPQMPGWIIAPDLDETFHNLNREYVEINGGEWPEDATDRGILIARLHSSAWGFITGDPLGADFDLDRISTLVHIALHGPGDYGASAEAVLAAFAKMAELEIKREAQLSVNELYDFLAAQSLPLDYHLDMPLVARLYVDGSDKLSRRQSVQRSQPVEGLH